MDTRVISTTETPAAFLISSFFSTRTVVIDKDSAYASGNYVFPVGAVLGKITATNQYGAYNPSQTDGTETALGILLERIDLYDGQSTRSDHVATMVVFGHVKSAALTQYGGSALDAAGKTDLQTPTNNCLILFD